MTLLETLRALAPVVTPGPWRKGSRRNCDIDIIGKPTWPCTRFGKKGEWDVAVVTELERTKEQRAKPVDPLVEVFREVRKYSAQEGEEWADAVVRRARDAAAELGYELKLVEVGDAD